MQVFRNIAEDDTAELRPSWWWPASFKRDECDFLDVLALQIADASSSYDDSSGRAAIQDLVNHSGPLTQQMATSDQAIRLAVNRDQALVRCLRLLNAIQRYEQSGSTFKPGVTDLGGLPVDAITDPYDGKLLRVKKSAQGWRIYSVGRDLADGKGRKLDPITGDDVGLGPPVVAEDE